MMNPNQPPAALDWGFLRRTLIAVVVAAVICAWGAWIAMGGEVAGRYLLGALWATFYLGMTGLLMKFFMFDNRKVAGMLAVTGKIASLVILYFVLTEWWVFPESPADRPQLLAMVAGLTTPLAVLVLRIVSRTLFVMNESKPNALRSAAPGGARAETPTEGVESHS